MNLDTKIGLEIRSLTFYSGCILGLILFSGIASLLIPFLNAEKRQYVFSRYNVFVIWWSEFICGVHYEIEGLNNIPEGACVVLSNHQSSLETFLLQTLFSPLSTVLKQELLKIPFFGWGAKILEPIALDRRRPTQAYKQLIAQGQERIDQNRSVLIFPEGTRVSIGEKVKFNRGGAALAYHTQAPIIPIAHNAGLRWTSRRLLLPGTVTVRIGKPIHPAAMNKKELYDESTKWIETNRDNLMASMAS